MNASEVGRLLEQPQINADEGFTILQTIANMLGSDPESASAQALLIRALQHREAMRGASRLLNALLRETGLYPYADPEGLSDRDRLAFELHRPRGMLGDEGTVFHRVQAQVYWHLLDGRNVILSAPTSFGKSLVIDAMIGSREMKCIVLVVPTLALIDETRRRLERFSDHYKIITHASQLAPNDGRGRVYVLTQERVIERDDLTEVDLVVIDEFYKLDPGGGADRAGVLNHAFYKLLKVAQQFYLLGPNIRTIPIDFRDRFSAEVIVSDFATVATDVRRVDIRLGRKVALVALTKSLREPALIYCQSPGSVRRVAKILIDEAVTHLVPELRDAVEWLGRHYHSEWIVIQALERGIGVHHGRLPRAIAQLQVKLFNAGKLRFLVCTSTLIEGVNTAAKHVVIYDNQIAKTKFDYFTFKNIQGRSGRMFRHFVGTVHLFHEPPQPELLDVDIPAFTQTDAASDMLLVQIDAEDLSVAGGERMGRLHKQSDLSFDTIKANAHIEPELQIDMAKFIARDPLKIHALLGWRGDPTGDQIFQTCELLFDTLLRGVSRDAVRSGKQLGFLVKELKKAGGVTAFMKSQVRENARGTPDDRVENALDFLRNWASFHVPRSLIALERIQEEVFGRFGLRPGSYSSFAARLENLMLPGPIAALDEYGIPLPLAERLVPFVRTSEGLDEVLADLRNLDWYKLGLSEFEGELIDSFRKY